MFTHAILADTFLKGLYESQALWNKMNRSFDAYVADKIMDSVDIPLNPQLVVSSTAVASDSANRKKAKADTGKVNVPFALYTIPLTQEMEAKILMNGRLLQNFLADMTDAFNDAVDKVVIEEAQKSSKVLSWKGAKISFDDIIGIDQKFNELKVPKRDRIIIVPASLQSDFMAIDVVKQAMAYNQSLLEKGIFVINNTQFYISASAGKVGGKENLVGIATPGLAVVLKGYMDRNEVYSLDDRATHIDYNTGVAIKLLKDEFAIVSKQP